MVWYSLFLWWYYFYVFCLVGDMASHYSGSLLSIFLSSTNDDDDLIRAGALTNIGEICKLLKFSLQNVVQEVKWWKYMYTQIVTTSYKTRFLQDFVIILKRILQNYYKILKVCFFVTNGKVWLTNKWLRGICLQYCKM